MAQSREGGIGMQDCGDIIQEFLTLNGFDGLCNPDLECGCGKDELCPCSPCESILTCRPAYKHICTDCPNTGSCDLQDEYGLDYCYATFKEPRKKDAPE